MSSDRRDVVVIGGGTMGTMALWRLAERGVKAVCFEQFSPGHDRGAAGGETRIFRTAYLEDPQYVPLLQEALHLWRELEAASGQHLLTLNGALMVGDVESVRMQNVMRSIAEYGLRHERLTGEQLEARYPQHRTLAGDSAVLDLDAGFLRADLALVSAAARAAALGSAVERYARVEALAFDAQGVTVRVDGHDHRFRTAVVAPGPWVGKVLPQLSSLLTVKRPTQAWFAARDPDQFQPERNPVLLRMSGVEGAYVLPSTDGVAVKVGLSSSSHELVADPDLLDRTITTAQMRQFRQVAEAILPGVFPDPTRYGAYLEAYTADGHAMVGTLPGAGNVVLLCGFSGHGFKLAPVIGDIAADLVLGGRTPRPIRHLAPERYLPR
ncbi:MAG: N-methyl-L-tryptophan oxidase [Candidatus Dormibacteraceae bacterium]